MSIPEKHLVFCREVAALAAAHCADKFNLTFTPSFDDDWQDEISMHWGQGRHGEDSHKTHVTSTVLVVTPLKATP